MPIDMERLEDKLLTLSEDNRVRLATTLLHSLPIPDGILEEGTPEFEAEIARRSDEVKNGDVEMIPYETVMRELDEMLRA